MWVAYSSETAAPSRFARPSRTLGAFTKVSLAIGEQKTIVLSIPKDATAVWDEKREYWCCEQGTYNVSIVTAPGQEVLEGEFRVEEDEFWSGL